MAEPSWRRVILLVGLATAGVLTITYALVYRDQLPKFIVHEVDHRIETKVIRVDGLNRPILDQVNLKNVTASPWYRTDDCMPTGEYQFTGSGGEVYVAKFCGDGAPPPDFNDGAVLDISWQPIVAANEEILCAQLVSARVIKVGSQRRAEGKRGRCYP